MTNDIDITHVEQIREVFKYSLRFPGKRFVFQISSAIVEHPLFPALVKDLGLLHHSGINIILVPGAQVGIDHLLGRFNIEAKYHNGLRISSEESLPLIKMAAFDTANRLMGELSSHKLSSVIGNWVSARAIGVRDGVDYQMTGAVSSVNISQIQRILNDRLIPILPCIGWNSGGVGKAYTISSLELARHLAAGLAAEKLFFITGENLLQADSCNTKADGVIVANRRITRFTIEGAAHFLANNKSTLTATQREIIEQGRDAAAAGVPRVHILDGRSDGAVLQEVFSTNGIGTMIHADAFDAIRSMGREDINDVLGLMSAGVEDGSLVPRTREELQQLVQDYVVFETDGSIRGCGAVHEFSDGSAEIAGMAVDPGYAHLGVGGRILHFLIDRARTRGVEKLFALTTRASDWFLSMGFVRGEIKELPQEKQQNYNNNRNSRIYMYRL